MASCPACKPAPPCMPAPKLCSLFPSHPQLHSFAAPSTTTPISLCIRANSPNSVWRRKDSSKPKKEIPSAGQPRPSSSDTTRREREAPAESGGVVRTSVMPEPTEVRRERQAQGMQLERNSNFNMGTDLGDRKSNSNMATDWGDRKSIQKTKMASGNTPRILVSPLLSIHEEEELMPKEPCATPSWEMFASTQYGVWRGVGAAYCPLAKMKPISRGDADEYLYDCRTCSTVEEVQGTNGSSIQRKTMWAVGNPNGEQDKREREELAGKDIDCPDTQRRVTADLNSVELSYDALMEEDVMERDPGLFFFEDGSYSKGTFLLFKEDPNNLNPTYKIEQCLVRGRHRRVRVVHNLEVEENRLNIKWHGVAVYEEEWMGPDPVKSIST